MLTRPAELTEADLAAIAELERRVVRTDGGRLKLSWSMLRDAPSDLVDVAVWHEDGRLLGFVGTYSFAAVPELTGMVDPAARRRGIASGLLAEALRRLSGQPSPEALLVCPRTGSGGADFARARGGRPDHSEHALVLRGSPRHVAEHPGVAVRRATDDDAEDIRHLLADGFRLDPGPTQTVDESAFVVERDGVPVGFLRAELDGQRGDVYGFVIRADLRGQGIGRDVLARAVRELFRRGARSVGLEVETANERALGLYTSLGFERVVTEDYYRLAVPGR